MDSSSTPYHFDVASPAPEDQKTVRNINLVADWDLIFVLSNFSRTPGSTCMVKKAFWTNIFNKYEIGSPSDRFTEVYARISTSHLTFVSQGFAAMLRPEGQSEVRADGCRIYHDDEDDAHVMVMLLLIVFGKLSLVPQKLSLHELKFVCVLIDKYLLQDATDFMTRVWADQLRSQAIHSDNDAANAMCIGHVLRQNDFFESGLTYYWSWGTGPLIMIDLPFPDLLLRTINDSRTNAFDTLQSQVDLFIDVYRSSGANTERPYLRSPVRRRVCGRDDSNCDALVLGRLILWLTNSGRFNSPSTPSLTVNGEVLQQHPLRSCIDEFKGINIKTYCDTRGGYLDKYCASIQDRKTKAVEEIENKQRDLLQAIIDRGILNWATTTAEFAP